MKRTDLKVFPAASDPTAETDAPKPETVARIGGNAGNAAAADDVPDNEPLAEESHSAPAMSAAAYPCFLYHMSEPSKIVKNPEEWNAANVQGWMPLAWITDNEAERKAIVERG